MIKRIYFFKIVIPIFSLILLSNQFLLSSKAKIRTRDESENFLNQYCIEIVNAIKEAYENQISALKENDLRKFGEQGKWIGGLSDIYSKLCKK